MTLSLFVPSTWACRLDPSPNNTYDKQGNNVVYTIVGEEVKEIPGINFHRLHRLPDLAKTPDKQPEWYTEPPLTDLATDFVYSGVNLTRSYYSYHSDGRHILWAGQIVRNPPGLPQVDIATFKVFGRFAADKHSLYFDGKRTENNHGVDMATLTAVEFNDPWLSYDEPEFTTILKDQYHLYLRGHQADNPESFTVLAQKPWYQSGKFTPINPCVAGPVGPWDTLARTSTQIIINGNALDADPTSFTVVRWIPATLLIYRDKNGTRRVSLEDNNAEQPTTIMDSKDCWATFNMLEDKVTWRKEWEGDDCQIETIPGLDPEQFHPINGHVAQYQDRLYAVKKTQFGDNYLDVITLDDPNLIIERRFNAGKHHGYLVTSEGSIEVFESAGPLVLLDNEIPGERESHTMDDQYRPNWFAHDDRYVYVFTGVQLYRYASTWPQYAHIEGQQYKAGYGSALSKSGGRLVTLEGEYFQDMFIPKKKESNKQ